jgi:hypothetical protein
MFYENQIVIGCFLPIASGGFKMDSKFSSRNFIKNAKTVVHLGLSVYSIPITLWIMIYSEWGLNHFFWFWQEEFSRIFLNLSTEPVTSGLSVLSSLLLHSLSMVVVVTIFTVSLYNIVITAYPKFKTVSFCFFSVAIAVIVFGFTVRSVLFWAAFGPGEGLDAYIQNLFLYSAIALIRYIVAVLVANFVYRAFYRNFETLIPMENNNHQLHLQEPQ